MSRFQPQNDRLKGKFTLLGINSEMIKNLWRRRDVYQLTCRSGQDQGRWAWAPGLGEFAPSAVKHHNGGNLNPCHVTHDNKDSQPSDFICTNFLRNSTFGPIFQEEFDLSAQGLCMSTAVCQLRTSRTFLRGNLTHIPINSFNNSLGKLSSLSLSFIFLVLQNWNHEQLLSKSGFSVQGSKIFIRGQDVFLFKYDESI